jgi:hypothetical protein
MAMMVFCVLVSILTKKSFVFVLQVSQMAATAGGTAGDNHA